MYNSIQLIGRLGQDPELKYTPDGKSIASFTLAVDDKEKGEKITTWFKVTFFGNISDSIKQYTSKGDLVFVDGKLRIRDYTNKEGQKAKDISVSGDQIKFLQTKRKDGPPEEARQDRPQTKVSFKKAPAQKRDEQNLDEDDSI